MGEGETLVDEDGLGDGCSEGDELGDAEAVGVGDAFEDGLGLAEAPAEWGPAYLGLAADADGHATATMPSTITAALIRMGTPSPGASSPPARRRWVVSSVPANHSNYQQPHIEQ